MATRKRRRYRETKRKGAAMVEMALILSLFTTMVFAMIEATRMCMVAQLLTNAARDGCRVAASPGKAAADVTTRVNATLTNGRITPSLVTTTVSPSSIENTHLTDTGWITVTVSVPFASVNWFTSPFFYGSSTITATAVMRSQRP